MFVEIGIEITFFGVGLCVLQAVELALEMRTRKVPGVLFYLFNAVIMFGIAMTARGVPQTWPETIFLFLTSLLLIGPLNLFYYHTLLYHDTQLPYRIGVHLVPALVFFLIEVVFQCQPMAFKREMLTAFFADPANHWLTIPLAVASLHVLVYAIIIMHAVISDINIRESRKEFRFIMFVAAGIILVIALLLGGFMAGKPVVFISGSIMNVMIHISLYIGTRTYPQFFTTWKKEIKKKRYDKSMLGCIDTDIIRDRLDELMRDEALYRESEISLSTVAGRLEITPHQLSQLLNERMNTGFWDYVNRLRVEEAMALLKNNSEVSIISVCFRVGFNSKSSFNAAFKKMTGVTPRNYKSGGVMIHFK
jgi:AraC-like DNA-binding protein